MITQKIPIVNSTPLFSTLLVKFLCIFNLCLHTLHILLNYENGFINISLFAQLFKIQKTYTLKILNQSFQTNNSVKNSTNVENFEEFGQKEPWKPVFLTFSTEFSTKPNSFFLIFNCPKKLLLLFCNMWDHPHFSEILFRWNNFSAL